MEQKILYKCDPDKNTACRKTHCKYDPCVVNGECDSTSQEQYAVLDDNGKPIITYNFIRWYNRIDK